ncbi:hypothetical protein SEA_BOBSWAGET_76 [Mycobacterium phage BobSwaget]|nr:hypothetical protein SEA_BOBSWAGET_76 [Mycobacterium phage BobSwaget]ASW31421.1 hypothetical protein SEA_LOKK_77 [Mycobacterium phage Lokk]QDF18474.1 hypothetical protein SEA_RACHALY_79 [Mycobacterium Phage Rachaly]
MGLRAKCKHCTWKVRAEGSVYLHLAMEAHRRNTGHKVKVK